MVPYISPDLMDMYLDINHFKQNFNHCNRPMSWHYNIKNLEHWSQIWVDTEPTELSLIGIFNFFLNAVDLLESYIFVSVRTGSLPWFIPWQQQKMQSILLFCCLDQILTCSFWRRFELDGIHQMSSRSGMDHHMSTNSVSSTLLFNWMKTAKFLCILNSNLQS